MTPRRERGKESNKVDAPLSHPSRMKGGGGTPRRQKGKLVVKEHKPANGGEVSSGGGEALCFPSHSPRKEWGLKRKK